MTVPWPYIVYNKLEDSISSFIEELPQELKEFVSFDKSQRLKRDLEQLQFDFSKDLDKVGPVFNNQDLNSNHIIGMLYVIEGSMLGGMMIANQLEHCTELSEIEEHHFFGGNPKIHGQRWRKFVKALDTLVLEEKEVRDIIEGAKEAFNYFDKVFATELVI